MDDSESASTVRAEVVRLIIHQESIYQNWAKFVITIQGGLAAGLGFVLSSPTKYRSLGLVIAALGFVTAIALDQILTRHARWSVWYVRKCNNLAADSDIFPNEPGEIGRLDLGPVARWVRWVMWAVALAWIVIVIYLLVAVAAR
jgi:hypothetical protein